MIRSFHERSRIWARGANTLTKRNETKQHTHKKPILRWQRHFPPELDHIAAAELEEFSDRRKIQKYRMQNATNQRETENDTNNEELQNKKVNKKANKTKRLINRSATLHTRSPRHTKYACSNFERNASPADKGRPTVQPDTSHYSCSSQIRFTRQSPNTYIYIHTYTFTLETELAGCCLSVCLFSVLTSVLFTEHLQKLCDSMFGVHEQRSQQRQRTLTSRRLPVVQLDQYGCEWVHTFTTHTYMHSRQHTHTHT